MSGQDLKRALDDVSQDSVPFTVTKRTKRQVAKPDPEPYVGETISVTNAEGMNFLMLGKRVYIPMKPLSRVSHSRSNAVLFLYLLLSCYFTCSQRHEILEISTVRIYSALQLDLS